MAWSAIPTRARQILAVWLMCMTASTSMPVAAQAVSPPRIGLVIANGNYANPSETLNGARRDGHTLKQALEQVGFRVTLVENATKPQMETAIKTFQRALRDGGPTAVGFLYYAGHGSADSARTDNYLLPVDIHTINSPQIGTLGLGVRWITDLLRAGDPRPAIAVVVDACRSVAIEPSRGGPSHGTRATHMSDLIEPDELPDRGYLVAFSTSKGRVASDDGRYAESLAAKIGTAGLTLDQVFEQVRQEVATRTTQLPTSRSTLVEKVCLAGCVGVAKSDSLAVLKTAVAERATGDVGQIEAIRQLAREGKSLSGFDLKGLYLKSGDLDNVDFSAAELHGVNLDDARLQRARLSQAHLAFATLRGTRAVQADAREARMYFVDAARADFSDINAERSNWRGASLPGASFRGAKLRGASFMLADLRDADFRGADLSGAFFIGAVVTGAKFDEAALANTDFTGAVGDAQQFSATQQSALCATENSRGFRVRLVRVTKSARFKSGEEYDNLVEEYVSLGRGLSQLDRCQPRSALPAGGTTVWKGRNHEETAGDMAIHLPSELLDRAGRQRQYVDRMGATLAMLNAARESGPSVRVRGEQYRRLLAALQANVSKVKLESAAILDGDAMTMFMLRFQPDSMPDKQWAQMAEQWAAKEANGLESLRRNYRNHWPPFFPPGTSASELAPEHVEVFKRWTLQRARAYPSKVVLEERHLSQLRHAVLQARNQAPGNAVVIRPLRALIQEKGAPRFSPSLAPLMNSASTHLSAAHGGWSDGGAVIRLQRLADSYEMPVPPSAVAAAQNETLGLRMMLEVRGWHTVKAGSEAMAVLDAEVSEMQLLGADGQPIR